ncbi:MAG: succinylglutamate desuccinylase/aspartoacylase family protein [Cyclobacteriaceae bacterium]
MIEVHSKALQQSIHIDRTINRVSGRLPGPTVIFFGGIHGNEPAGVFALHEVLKNIEQGNTLQRGTVIGIAGNLSALPYGVRYRDVDLNRIWTEEKLHANHANANNPISRELNEQKELLHLLKDMLSTNTGPFYFIDLHTTSSATTPFITLNDTIINRKFAMQFKVPVILGIEEHLEGPLLSYINEWGYISIGFEAGQHNDLESIFNHKDFIIKVLEVIGMLGQPVPTHRGYPEVFYEITYRHLVKAGDQFKMCHGFQNFQDIATGQLLAFHNGEWIEAKEDGIIFMPLYQDQGDEGYFLISKVAARYLKLSLIIRCLHLDSWLTWLPGIRWRNELRRTLVVNKRIARFFAKDFLHLMGYRVRQVDGDHLLATKRENRTANRAYRKEVWLRK